MDARARVAEILTVVDGAHRLRQQLVRRTVELTGLTPDQAVILCQIEQAGGEATVSKIAAGLHRASNTVTGRIDGLERHGLVSRRHDDSGDRRRVWVRITSEGMERIRSYWSAADALFDTLVADLEERAQLARMAEALSNIKPHGS